MDRASRRTHVISKHLIKSSSTIVEPNFCLQYSAPELSETPAFDVSEMRKLIDGHHLKERDWLFELMIQSKLFNPRISSGRVFVSPDYNQSMEQQRDMTMKRIKYLLDCGVFKGWLTGKGPEVELRSFALFEVVGMFDHSLASNVGFHCFLWYVLMTHFDGFSYSYLNIGYF